MDEVTYYQDQEIRAMGRFLDSIVKAVSEQSQGRNRGCWPVLSFGWKDADLDPEGCTGIKEITIKDENTLYVEVGGHKTFCYSEIEDDGPDSESKRDVEWEFLCDACTGYSVDGDIETFTAGFHDVIAVPVKISKRTLDVNVKATVKAIIKAAEKRCGQFHKQMADIAADYEKIC